MRNYLRIILSAVFSLLVTSTANADVVVADDLIVQGASCIGWDCVNGEAFIGDVLRLKDNNLRIRFIDTSAADSLERSWNISANESVNGGANNFTFEAKSLTQDTFIMSDGTAILWDCTNFIEGVTPPIDTGLTIPAGEPVISEFTCDTLSAFTFEYLLKFGSASNNGVAIGSDSSVIENVVSVGKTDLLRKIKHVSEGMAATDLLIKQSLDEFAATGPITEQLDAIEAQVAELERLVNTMSDSDFSGSGTGSFNSAMLALLLLTLLIPFYVRKKRR